MGFLDSKKELETVDAFIEKKVEQLLEQSIIENKKRRKIEEKVYKKYSVDVEEELHYLGAVSDLSQFPKYSGRGMQEHAPDIQGTISDDGFTTMTLWYREVSLEEVEEFKELLISNRFLGNKNEYTKETSKLKYYVMIEYSESSKRMRLYHTITKIK